MRRWTLRDRPWLREKAEAGQHLVGWPRWQQGRGPVVVSASPRPPASTHSRIEVPTPGKVLPLCNLYSQRTRTQSCSQTPPPPPPRRPQSPHLHTEVLGFEWTVNHHFGILYCFWVNRLCSPFPSGRKTAVGGGGRLLLGTQWPRGCTQGLLIGLEAQPSPKLVKETLASHPKASWSSVTKWIHRQYGSPNP